MFTLVRGLDIKMPPTYTMEGIEAAHVIKSERPHIGVVVLSQHKDEGCVWAAGGGRGRAQDDGDA